jgi:hypothetical protein
VKASDSGSIAGTTVAFPPGSLAVATDISISPGENLSSSAILSALALGTNVTASGAAVTIDSSVAMDTAQPFRVSLSLPDGASLTDNDALANLIVLYKVKIAETGELVTGLIPRSDINTEGGRAEISTRHFGSFQAILTESLVAEAKEVPTPAPSAVARSYFIRGAMAATFGADGQRTENFQGWALGMTPMKVGTTATLTTGIVARPVPGQ